MVASDRPNLCDTKIKALEDLITEYKGKCRVMNSGDYGRLTLPPYQCWRGLAHLNPSRLPFTKQAKVRKVLKDMKQCGVTEQANNPWLSPIVFIQKKNGDFCLDYRKLNDISKKSCFPPLRIKKKGVYMQYFCRSPEKTS
jgi:hypothetical protein